jgi:predicted ABC-type ATPase
MDLNNSIYTDFVIGDVVSEAEPRLIVIGGGLGCGKNTLLFLKQQDKSLPTSYIIHEPDKVMARLPEFQLQSMLDPHEAFARWEPFARNIANELTHFAFRNRSHHVYVRSLSLIDSLETLYKAKHEWGYFLEIHIVQCSLSKAMERIKLREQVQSRHIVPNIIESRYEQLQQNLPYIQKLADQFEIWDNEQDNIQPISLSV